MALSWADRLARLPMTEEDLINGIAEAVYQTHQRTPAPLWKNAREGHQEWSRAQARNVLTYLRTLTRPAP